MTRRKEKKGPTLLWSWPFTLSIGLYYRDTSLGLVDISWFQNIFIGINIARHYSQTSASQTFYYHYLSSILINHHYNNPITLQHIEMPSFSSILYVKNESNNNIWVHSHLYYQFIHLSGHSLIPLLIIFIYHSTPKNYIFQKPHYAKKLLNYCHKGNYYPFCEPLSNYRWFDYLRKLDKECFWSGSPTLSDNVPQLDQYRNNHLVCLALSLTIRKRKRKKY